MASRKGALTEEDVLDVVAGGDAAEIRRWIELSLPFARPLDAKSEHSSAAVNPDVYAVLTSAMRRLPPATRSLLREELGRRGVFIHSGSVDEIWSAVMGGDYLGIRHWVRSLPLDECSVDRFARLVRPYNAELSPTLVQDLIKVNAKATPAVSAFLLDELAKRGVFLPFDRPIPLKSTNPARLHADDDPAAATPGGSEAAADAADDDGGDSSESDDPDAPDEPPRAYDFTRLVIRLARTGLLFRPRPLHPDHKWMDRIAPVAEFSPFHHFVVSYLSSFGLKAVLEAYSAWYELHHVSHRLFEGCAERFVMRASVPSVRGMFRRGEAENALGAALMFRPSDYDPSEVNDRGIFQYIEANLFDSAAVRFEYMTPLITRIDLRDMRPTYDRVERRLVDMAEFRLALQRPVMPDSSHSNGYRVAENIQGAKSDSTLYSYVYNQAGVNADGFLSRSLWAVRLDESMTADDIRRRAEEQRAQAILRDWLRHRAPVSAVHASFTVVRPSRNGVWDVMSNMAVRVALANFVPRSEPKYDFPPELNEFATHMAYKNRGGRKARGSTCDDEVVGACFTYLDMVGARDTVDAATLALYLDAAEVFWRYHPDIFGERQLMKHLDLAYQSAQPLLRATRPASKWLRPTPELVQLKQLPADLRKVFTALGVVYSKDTTEVSEKREVLRLLTMFFMHYNVQFSDNLAATWRKLENGAPTANLVRWFLAMAGAFRMSPSAFMQQMSRSSGLFDGRPEVLEHLALLVGAPSGLVASPALLLGAGGDRGAAAAEDDEEGGGALEDRRGSSVWDRTSWLVHQMPANLDRPVAGTGDPEWVGAAVLRKALRSVSGHAPFDSALPALAFDLGARREDAFMVTLLTHEAAYARRDNRLRAPDQATEMPPAGRLPYRWRDIEECMLRLVSRRWYMILVHALKMFYPRSAALSLARGLMDLSRGKYSEFRTVMLKFVPLVQQQHGGGEPEQHLTGNPKWTAEMAEEMMRSAFGTESEFAEPSPYERTFLAALFDDLGYEAGTRVLDELLSTHRQAKPAAAYDFTTSEQLYERKMEEFEDFVAEGSFVWEYRWERQRFYAEVEAEFRAKTASPVVAGAFFYTVWCRFKYLEPRKPFHAFEALEELQLLYHATRHWQRCDQEVYGEVVRTLHARMYCLMVAHDMDQCQVTVNGEEVTLMRDAYFPESTREPRPDDPAAAAIAAAAAAVNAAPRRKPDFLPDADASEVEKVQLFDDVNGDESKHDDAAGGGGGDGDDDDDDEPEADLEANIERERARMAADKEAAEADKKSGYVAKRLDMAGFLVYRPLRPRHYMPLASQWLDKWREEQKLEREAAARGVSLEDLQRQLSERAAAAKDGAADGSSTDQREMDVQLFIEVMDRMLYRGWYQMAFGLANDVLDFYPRLFEQTLPELQAHMNRIRLVFYVAGIMNLKFKDLGLEAPADDDEEEEEDAAAAGRKNKGGGFVGKWRANKPVPKAANFANVQWLPDDAQNSFVVVARRRVGWNSETKVNVIRHLLVTLFPRVNPVDVRDHMQSDRKAREARGRVAILGEFKRHDPELGRVCDLFISALLIHHKERERGFSDRSVAETVASLVEKANDGSLPLMMAIARACGDTSVVSLLNMEPGQVVFELLQNTNDFVLIKQYLRVVAPPASEEPVRALALAYEEWLERRVERETAAMEEEKAAAERKAMRLSGREWADSMAAVNEAYARRSVRMLDEGWGRNRLIAYVGCASERRQMDVLGERFHAIGRRVDISGGGEALRILRFELLYAAYFAYFAAAHQRGMRAVLETIDRTLVTVREHAPAFKMFVQRTLFLTGEYKSLPMALGHAVKEHRSASIRAELRREALGMLEGKRTELQRLRALRAEEEARLAEEERAASAAAAEGEGAAAAADDEKKQEPEEEDEKEQERQEEEDDDDSTIGREHIEKLQEAVQDEMEVEMSGKRYSLVVGLLEALRTRQGYELFQELEKIASSFKDLAWQYQDLQWWKQALDCHRVGELVQVEMEYIPSKLSHLNFVDPDEHELHQIWKAYSTRLPMRPAGPAQAAGAGGAGAGAGAAGDESEIDYYDDERGGGNESDDEDALRNPDLMAPEQLQLLIGDCVLSGVEGRYLERVRREFARDAQVLQAQGKLPGRVYKSLHSLIAATSQHFVEQCAGEPITKDELKHLVISRGETMVEFDPTRKHVHQEPENAEDRTHPSTVLFFTRDRFDRWNLHLDDSNAGAAQVTLKVLNNLHRYKQAELFKQFYYEQ